MKLDPRIKSLSDILTCFDIERAEQFIGQKGYFADGLSCYHNLANRTYDTLTHIKDGDYPFKEGNDSHWRWRYFIPECSLKPKEKQYRALTIVEFLDRFHFGEGIVVRSKAKPNIVYHVLFVGYLENLENGKNEENIILGQYRFSLQELFSSYERFYNGRWYPFGMEVTE